MGLLLGYIRGSGVGWFLSFAGFMVAGFKP